MSAKKNAPARDRPVSNAEFADWVREAVERREGRTGEAETAGAALPRPRDAQDETSRRGTRNPTLNGCGSILGHPGSLP
jgi:hypothetical protein